MAADTLFNVCRAENKSQGGALLMKFLFHNDKSTIKDELYLLVFILVCIGVGSLCCIFAPNDWIISENTIKVFGIVWILTGVMFIPALVYRLFTNDTTKKNS